LLTYLKKKKVNKIEIDQGSFRDPAGRIFYYNEKVLRLLNKEGEKRYNFLKKKNLLDNCISNKFLIQSNEVDSNNFNLDSLKNKKIIEHRKINYISYPYEWCFDQLKDAAIHHLNFHIFLLNNNATLIDGSAFNIQFEGYKPIFIDLLSIKEYQEGEYWKSHKQFCENFLNPLLLKSKKKIDFNNWFKGNLEGITTKDLNSILSFKDKFSFNIFTQVYLLNLLDQKAIKNKKINLDQISKKKFPKKSFLSMLSNMKNFIISLKIKKSRTLWDDYSKNNTYKKKEEDIKKKIVKEFANRHKFKILADLGCNDGVYSKICLGNGCEYVVGFDYDLNAINNAYKTSKDEKLNFLPLYFDASNPSSNLGWYQNERRGYMERLNFSGMLSLAFEHHLAIAKNIPLDQVLKWLINIAPHGLIEFVPKNDETIKKMLILKGDIFNDYNEENFRSLILKNANIVSETIISDSGRKIFEYQKN
jgi:ribosomal protein L11 methylase PrmA